MGKGLFLSIDNQSTRSVDVSYSDFNCVYTNGDSGSDFRPIQGSLAPGKNFGRQYIEAKASGACAFQGSTFAMSLKVDQTTLRVVFSEGSNTWSVNPPSFHEANPVEVFASMRPSGDQYECVITIKDAIGLNSSNWMSGLNDRQRFYDVLLPGTHDSGTYAYSNDNINVPASRFVQCQDCRSDFLTQLRNGIRFLDLRVRKVSEIRGDNLALFHGDGSIAGISKSVYLNVNLGDALQAVERFLRENPTETVVVSIKREDTYCEKATSDIGPEDIQAYIDKRYNEQRGMIKWVAGHLDFRRIKEERDHKGLADLNQDKHFQLVTECPRAQLRPSSDSWLPGDKLSYEHLVVGDVRGCAILMLRSMPCYQCWPSNIAALDYGTFSNGVYDQDDYAAPEYVDKKRAIIAGARGELPGRTPIQENQYSMNFLSAASTGANPASSPVSFALTINAGMGSRNYETDDELLSSSRSPSLRTLLSPGGELYAWNLQRRHQGLPGLRGVMAGDFLLCPQAWYEDFWGNRNESRQHVVADPNSTDYTVDDHLTRLIWSQNLLVNPRSPS
jgi:hypothetical protein